MSDEVKPEQPKRRGRPPGSGTKAKAAKAAPARPIVLMPREAKRLAKLAEQLTHAGQDIRLFLRGEK